MKQAVHEQRRRYRGLEFPIECYKLRSRPSSYEKTPHYHEYIEFLYASGECDISVWVSGKMVRFKTGDMMIINSNVPHMLFPQREVNYYICIKALPEMMYFSENSFFDIKYVMPFMKGEGTEYRFFGAEETAGSELSSCFDQMVNEWIKKDYGYEVSLRSSLFSIFLWAIRKSHQRGDEGHSDMSESEQRVENVRLIQRAVEYVSENYPTADERNVAASINLSYSHFSRVFKKVMGKSFSEYLLSVRVNAAERMLLETDVTVTEVALSCGFATSSHFIDRFKRAKGMTPRQYRNNFRI